MKKVFNAHAVGYVAVALAGSLILIGLSFWGVFGGMERVLEDRITTGSRPIDPSIVIIGIDDASLERIGRWPWPRSVFGQLVDRLGASHPAAVGIDVSFSESSTVADDAAFARALHRATYPIVYPIEGVLSRADAHGAFSYVSILSSPRSDFITPTTVLGSVNTITDPDGVVRSFLPSVAMPDSAAPVDAFAIALLKAAGLWRINYVPTSVTRIVYAGPPHTIRSIPAWRILSGEATIPTNAVVLIGSTASDLHDTVVAPTGGGLAMPGVEVHATIANMFLEGYHLADAPGWAVAGWIFFFGGLAVALVARVRRARQVVGWLAAEGIIATVGIVAVAQVGIVIPVIYGELAWAFPALGAFVYRYSIGEKERAAIRSLFSRYVSKEVLAEILKNPGAIALGGEEREITVLFSDIRGFTTLSESLPPKEIARILNDYFSVMTEEVIAHGGVLDKYIGDAIMAFWGAPVEDSRQAQNAIGAALAMQRRLKELNVIFAQRGDPEVRIGIGIYTGPAMAGNLGSPRRLNYTVIGDTVNVASRLEGLTKQYPASIIVGERTKEYAGEGYSFSELGTVAVKGKKEGVKIFGVDVSRIKNAGPVA